jgi:hypothetical protein
VVSEEKLGETTDEKEEEVQAEDEVVVRRKFFTNFCLNGICMINALPLKLFIH